MNSKHAVARCSRTSGNCSGASAERASSFSGVKLKIVPPPSLHDSRRSMRLIPENSVLMANRFRGAHADVVFTHLSGTVPVRCSAVEKTGTHSEPTIMTELQISGIVDSSRYSKFLTASVLLLATLPACLCAQGQAVAPPSSTNIGLTSTEGVDIVDGKAEIVDYKGRRAMHLNPVPNAGDDDSTLAIFPAQDFHDGVIEVDVAGSPRPGSPESSRGFIGVAFRLQEHGAKGEYFYLRPTNARSDDQLRRNHTVQYVSAPGYPWERLRKETPGVYESYADMETGAWTHMKILVSGTRASLYVNGAAQPCLIVNDLKLGDLHGPIALWSHSTTDGYFSNLNITR
jgi:hypothetical protein